MNKIITSVLSLIAALALVVGGVGALDTADAKAVRIEQADRKGGKTISYVEPFKIRKGEPRRLYVEFKDGSAWIFTPCKQEDSRNCFWWASTRGVPGGHSFIDLRGRLIYL